MENEFFILSLVMWVIVGGDWSYYWVGSDDACIDVVFYPVINCTVHNGFMHVM